MQPKQKEHLILAVIVMLAFVIRAATIWIGRPVFTGWFNHTYYYYVQTRGYTHVRHTTLPRHAIPFLLVCAECETIDVGWRGYE